MLIGTGSCDNQSLGFDVHGQDLSRTGTQYMMADDESGHRALNRSATNIPSACRIVNIAFNDAMILPYNANPSRIEFSERTGSLSISNSRRGRRDAPRGKSPPSPAARDSSSDRVVD